MKSIFKYLILVILLQGCNFVYCPKFDNDYFTWFPYKEGDSLTFCNENEIKKYIVKSYKANHRNKYNKHYLCGYCEEGIKIQLAGNKDTLDIDFQNYKNDKSYFKFRFEINSCFFDIQDTTSQKMICTVRSKDMILPKDTITNVVIQKEKGLVSFSKNRQVWDLYDFRKNPNAKDVLIEIEKCY